MSGKSLRRHGKIKCPLILFRIELILHSKTDTKLLTNSHKLSVKLRGSLVIHLVKLFVLVLILVLQ